eukprot:4268004-Alexandrium_andersonii.AAC.1
MLQGGGTRTAVPLRRRPSVDRCEGEIDANMPVRGRLTSQMAAAASSQRVSWRRQGRPRSK